MYAGLHPAAVTSCPQACCAAVRRLDADCIWSAALAADADGSRSARLAVPAGCAQRKGCASSCAAVGRADGDFCSAQGPGVRWALHETALTC